MLIKDRLKEFVRYLQLTNQYFEAECGLSNGYIANIRKGIGLMAMEKILEKHPELNKTWLLTGKGEMINESLKNEENSNRQKLYEYEKMYLDVIKSQSEQLKNYQKQTELLDDALGTLACLSNHLELIKSYIKLEDKYWNKWATLIGITERLIKGVKNKDKQRLGI